MWSAYLPISKFIKATIPKGAFNQSIKSAFKCARTSVAVTKIYPTWLQLTETKNKSTVFYIHGFKHIYNTNLQISVHFKLIKQMKVRKYVYEYMLAQNNCPKEIWLFFYHFAGINFQSIIYNFRFTWSPSHFPFFIAIISGLILL